METVEVQLVINAPINLLLKEFSDYDHAPVLHRKYVKSVKLLEKNGNVTLALWRLKVLAFWCTVKQRQTVIPPNMLINETISGFAAGTIEKTHLTEDINGTKVVDIIEITLPGLSRLLEKIVALYTKRLVIRILSDHKTDLESR